MQREATKMYAHELASATQAGILKGQLIDKLEAAQNMLIDGLNINQIIKYTELSESEFKKIKL